MSEINKAAQALGALGGKARARSISKERASEIGRKAGLASAAKRKQQAVTCPDCKEVLSGDNMLDREVHGRCPSQGEPSNQDAQAQEKRDSGDPGANAG